MQIDEEFFNNDEFRDNLKSFEESFKSGHPIYLDADDLTDIIDYYNLMHKDQEADKTADYALSLFPDAPGPITYKVRKCIDMDDIIGAEKYIDRFSEKSIDYYFIKAEIHLAKNEPEMADMLFEEALDMAEDEELDCCILDATNIFVDYNYFDMGDKWIQRVENKNTDDYIELKVKILSSFGEIEKVEALLNKAIDKNPYEHKYWNMMSCAQLINDKVSDALTSSEYSLAVTPDNPHGLMCKAQALTKLYQYNEAINYYLAYIAKYNYDPNGYVQLGYCFMSLSKNAEALMSYIMAERCSSGEPEQLCTIYENMALAFSHIHEEEHAMHYLEKLSKLSKYVDKYHVDMLKGYVLLESGKEQDGLVTLANMLKECHYHSVNVLKASVVLYENNLTDMAYQIMHDHFPFEDETIDFGISYYALYCYDLGKDEEFLKYLKMSVERSPEEAEMTLHHVFPEGMKPTEYCEYIKNNK